jgi:hypothetical protein
MCFYHRATEFTENPDFRPPGDDAGVFSGQTKMNHLSLLSGSVVKQ